MRLHIIAESRKEAVNTIAAALGEEVKYQGAPSFAYKFGAYTANKDGSIDVEDALADHEVLRELHLQGIIDNSWDEEREVLSIELPIENHTAATLTNLVRILACRSYFINKSVGCDNAFHIDERFLEYLDEQEPETVEDFIQAIEATGNNNSGIEFDTEKIYFCGFPVTEDSDKVKAYMDLAALINQMALTQKHVRIEKPQTENEKYSVRVWLLRLGMKGEHYKIPRQVLLKNLSGNGAFRTEEQAEAFRENHRVKKEA